MYIGWRRYFPQYSNAPVCNSHLTLPNTLLFNSDMVVGKSGIRFSGKSKTQEVVNLKFSKFTGLFSL